MTLRAALLLLTSTSLFAAEFQSGQAARAVLGQSSFSSSEAGIRATSLVVSQDHLHVADATHHILTFDLSRIGGARDDRSARLSNSCSVCLSNPDNQTNESVMPGVATVSVWGKSVAVADTVNHRVLIWRDATVARVDRGPDVVLGRLKDGFPVGPGTLSSPVSVALDGKRVYVGDAALHRILVWNSLPMSDDQPADVVLGQPDFTSSLAAEMPAPDSILTPVAMTSDGTNLFVADESSRRVLVFSPGDSALSAEVVSNSASLQSGAYAPGTLITVAAPNLCEITESAPAAGSLPRRLGGLEVVLDGQPLPLLDVSPSQVEAQIPYELGNRTTASLYVRVERGGIASVTNPVALKIVTASPGLFAVGDKEPRGGLVLHGAEKETIDGGAPVTGESPARPGEIVKLWAAGLGPIADGDTASSILTGRPHEGAAAPVTVPVTAQIDGQSAQVLSAKLPTGAIGVYEIQVRIPADIAGDSEARLTVSQDGFRSNTIKFPLQARR